MWQNRSAMGAGSVAVFTTRCTGCLAQWAPHQSVAGQNERVTERQLLQLAVEQTSQRGGALRAGAL